MRGAAVLLSACLTGCTALPPGQRPLGEADFATIQPGMTQDEVLRRFGAPTWAFRVRQENMTILNYRYDRYGCVIWQVSVLPDGIVRDAGRGYDPGCDGPNRRF